MDNIMHNCRLCNYQSDHRLMLDIFDEQTAYAEKIDSYLNLKISPGDKPPTSICFHCSQTLDNFHNFATKIKTIQKIIYPQQSTQFEEIAYEIIVIPNKSDVAETGSKIEHYENLNEEIELDQDQALKKEEEGEDDWPQVYTPRNIPSKLLESGLLLYKGEELMTMMSQFYNTSCEICATPFKKINELLNHQKDEHSITPYISCCSSKLTKTQGMIWHFVRHIEPEPFRCHICNYSVSRPKFLERHLQIHEDPSKKQFSCDKCDKRFIWKGALRAHLLNHQPESERKDFDCTICSRKYQSAGALSWHKKTAHTQHVTTKPKNLCEICSKTFATLTSFKEHLLTHSEDCEKLQLQCSQCGKWLKNQRCLKSHMRLHADVDYACSLCNYVTKKELLLKNHIITRHTADRPLACDECDKTFKLKRALTIHKAQHHQEGVKTGRTCEFCNKTFGSSTNYYTHRKNLHAEELKRILEERDKEKKLKRIQIGLESPSSLAN